jgi:hypothetical protein
MFPHHQGKDDLLHLEGYAEGDWLKYVICLVHRSQGQLITRSIFLAASLSGTASLMRTKRRLMTISHACGFILD